MLCHDDRGDQDDRNIFDTSPSQTYLVGLCTGMLPAAAFAATTTREQLLRLAPEIVRISLRLGIEASHRSSLIENSSESWATAITGITPSDQQGILDQFHREHVSVLSFL